MRFIPILMIGGLLLTGLGCRSRSEPKPSSVSAETSIADCMSDLDLNKLNKALQRCNEIVEAHGDKPAALADRSLLLTLMGKTDQACADVTQAMALLRQSKRSTDPMVVHELNVRHKSCKQRDSIVGNG
ncbi:hypothetical protein [Synechococcus sp. ROS8604]|jgi:hypothetical protein|uniref:hypothetical protein n=1 Tax=Synechococcus sp. ROS8604 TaxID=1442557 RepID=UPI001645DAFD|nr:hypothetical protein [Synechococcus sp. ROS8604]